MGDNRRRAAAGFFLAATLVLTLLQVPAGAQEDPYGSTSTTAPEVESTEASCQLTTDVGSAGVEVTATVSGVPIGETVRLLFDGAEVGRATAEQTDGQSTVATVQIRFTVPDVSNGTYLVAAVGSTFTAECSAEFTTGDPQVLGFTVERGAGSTDRGSLPRTGATIALLLAVAIALVFVGRSLIEVARQRTASARRGPE